ncbi:MAG TPA: hypothetical protein VN922_19665 [Bacteroidia bacterium]|nr:hypothetical protein [Bacteroidia bacterium]
MAEKKVRMFKVIALSVGGRGNKIFESGQTISENHLPSNTADSLVKSKHIEEVDSINEDESNFVPSDPEIIIGTEKNEDEVGEVDSEKNNVIKSEDEVETISHKATEEDLKNNPELVAAGIKIGDTIQIPKNDIVAGKVDELPEGTFKVFIDKDNNPREVKSIDDITKPELIFALNKESVEFSATSNKKDLYTLWINLK